MRWQWIFLPPSTPPPPYPVLFCILYMILISLRCTRPNTKIMTDDISTVLNERIISLSYIFLNYITRAQCIIVQNSWNYTCQSHYDKIRLTSYTQIYDCVAFYCMEREKTWRLLHYTYQLQAFTRNLKRKPQKSN